MPITATCPSCSQMCQVEDQYAGMMVQCPKCKNIIQVARPDAAAGQMPPPPPMAAPMPVSANPGASAGPAGPGFMETLQQSIASFGLDALCVRLLYAGAGCLAAMVLFTILPWFSLGLGIGTVLGISFAPGALNFLLSAGALAFLIVTLVVLKKKDIFDISLWVAGGWSALAALWRLVDVANYGSFSSIGLYLVLLASFGAAGCFGFIIFQRFIKKKM